MKKNNVLLLCDCIERYYFFRRFKTSGNYNFILGTCEPFIYILAKVEGFEIRYISSSEKSGDTQLTTDLKLSLEVAVGGYQLSFAEALFKSYCSVLKKLNGEYNFDKIFLWNGQHLLGLAAREVFSEQLMFLELSNLPDKLFIDRLGVNAFSSIYFNPEQLDYMNVVADEKHQEWLNEYELFKMHPPPQAKVSNFQLTLRVINVIFSAFRSFDSLSSLLHRLPKMKGKPLSFKKFNIKNESLSEKFVFCALQVSTDTQLMLHSDYSNSMLIEEAHKIAQEHGYSLYVKFHPAEKSLNEVTNILDLQKRLGFTLVSNNTNGLIKNCQTLVVNNSTVGLEGLIYKKDVRIFGRALYVNFDQNRLKKFIHSYLVGGVDYFSDTEIDADKLIKHL